MKLLLDTHIWLWYLLGDAKLSPQLQAIISDSQNDLWLSPISIWETIVLAEKGRINLQPTTDQWINRALNALSVQEAPLTHAIAILSRQIELPHQDPADRFIAATAIHHNLTLATVDYHLTNSSWLSTIS
jgi:PIN domain nuclease of toxin-antitoxin system